MIWLFLACTDEPGDTQPVDTQPIDTQVPVDTEQPVDTEPPDTEPPDTDPPDTEAPPVDRVYGLERVAEVTMPTARGPGSFASSRVNNVSYLVEGSGEVIRILTELYVGPSGEYCLGGGSGDSCAGGVYWTSDRITPTNPVASICLDDDNGRMFLVHETGGNIEVVDTDIAGEQPYTYNRSNSVVKVKSELASKANYNGGCHYDAENDALLLTAPDEGLAARIQVDDDEILETYTPTVAFEDLWTLDNGQLVALSSVGIHLVDAATLDLLATVEEPAVFSVAVDRGTGEVWYAHGDKTLLSVVDLLDKAPTPRSVDTTGAVTALAVDETTNVAWAVIEEDEATMLYMVQDDALGDVVQLEGTFATMGMAGTSGDLVVATRVDDAVEVDVFDARPDVVEDLPPVYGFLMTALEEPSDGDIDKECEGDGNDTFEAQMRAVEGNAAVLAELGVPVVVGVTWNFASTAERCDRLDIFDTLEGYGFELGVLVHNRPCYECTNQAVEDDSPDSCDPSSPYYCNPDREDCCFPADESYCELGDYDCYLAYMETKVPDVERMLPSGAAFVAGADRHGMWEWNWRKAYTELSRTDGSVGYDVTFFAQAWAYDDEVDPDDPRGKNPAPWHAEESTKSWAIGTGGDWTDDSAFSDMLYLPGLAISTNKLAEWQSSGLHMIDFLASGISISYGTTDFNVLTQHLRRSLNNRSVYEPNTWYFHIPDLGLVNFADYQGKRTGTESYLVDWLAEIDARYVETGEYVWSTPRELRDAFPPR